MEFLSKSERSALQKLVGRDLTQRWEGIEQRIAAKETVTIVNTGLVNSGKSSLFNALLDAFETERFPVGAVRTTKHGDRERLNDWVEIIDTPGIDATNEDDEVAFRTLMEADLIVVTHNIKTGPLNRSEYEWLQRLAASLSGAELSKRIVFVCTWVDERDREEGYQDIVGEVHRQVTEVLKVSAPFWEVSAKRYLTARQKGIEAMAAASKIPELKSVLLQKADQVRGNIGQARKKELLTLCNETSAKLSEQRGELTRSMEKKTQKIQQQHLSLMEAWISILDNFRSMRTPIRKKAKELKAEDSSAVPAGGAGWWNRLR